MPKYKGNRIRVVGNIICIHLATHESKHLVFRRGGTLEYKYFADNDKEDPFIKFNNLMKNAYTGANTMEEDIMIQDSEIINYEKIITGHNDDGSFDEIELDMMFEDKIKIDSNGEIYRSSKRIFNTTEWIRVSHTNPNEPYVDPVPVDNTIEIDSINLYRRSDINGIIKISNNMEICKMYNELKKEANKLESENDKAIILKFLEDYMDKRRRRMMENAN